MVRTKKRVCRIALYFGILLGLALVAGLGFFFSVKAGFFGPLPDYAQLRKIEQNNASKILSSDGHLLGLYYYQNRTNTKLEDIPQTFIDGLIATEDVRFYRHHGFDSRSFLRVVVKSILLFDRSAGGGSTISQQLAKNLFPRQDFGLMSMPVAKAKEIITAMRLERLYTKEQILELYLNTVPFGENTYGIETAAITYFNKSPAELTIPESAVLVGLLKANTSYNPRLNTQAAFTRRNTVIGQMVKYDYLDKETADSLKMIPVEIDYHKLDHIRGLAPYFREVLRHESEDILEKYNAQNATDYNLYADGLTIYTTLNANVQAKAEEAVAEQLAILQQNFRKEWAKREPWLKNSDLARMQIQQSVPYKKFAKQGLSYNQILDSLQKPHPTKIFTWQGEADTVMSSLDSILYHFGILQSGMMAMDGQSGEVLAWVGGPDFKYFQYDHVLASRQVGSTIKPLVYATAIDMGLNPCEYFRNDSIVYANYDNWIPKNADNKYGGFYSVEGALVNSVNTVSVQILMKAGIANTILRLQEAGISAPLPGVPSLALGSAEIPLYQMVQAYSVFVNNGIVARPHYIRKITDSEGKIIYEHTPIESSEPVFSEATVEVMQKMLMGVANRGTAAGLRSRYGIHSTLGGKTVTTQNQTDGWFMGITPKMVVGVWIGGDNPAVRFRTLNSGQGGHTAMPVFARFINKIAKDVENNYLLDGNFDISPQVDEFMSCEDFKEKQGLFEFLKAKPSLEALSDREMDTLQPQKIEEEEKERSGFGRFIRSIFGKKDKNREK